jgi:hypothetical protein
MVLSKNVRNVAQIRIRGYGLKCEIGIYGRSSPDKSAICVKTELFKMRNTFFKCMCTEHFRHQFNNLFDNVSDGEIKVEFNITQRFTNSVVQLLMGPKIGTHRLSNHARL